MKPGNAGGGKGPEFKTKRKTRKDREIGKPEQLRKAFKAAKALHAKAKAEPGFRFYLLYDKIYREDILEHAYARCAPMGGRRVWTARTSGIEEYGLERWLGELAEALKEKDVSTGTDQKGLDRKGQRNLRPLGIPTIRDRVVADGGGAGHRTDLRGRSAARAIRISTEAKRSRMRARSTVC